MAREYGWGKSSVKRGVALLHIQNWPDLVGRPVLYMITLDQFCFLQGLVRTIFSDCAERLGRYRHCYMLIEFWYVDTALLQIWLTFCLATRIKLRRTRAVTVSSPNLGFLAGYLTLLSHKSVR